MMKILDLFCGDGGASMGLHLALKEKGIRHEITGIDIKECNEYPFNFKQGDALEVDLSDFDFIWSSPPCQAYSYASAKHRNLGKKYPDLIEKTREILITSNKPYVIENVVGSKLNNPIILTGMMFNLGVIRRRKFEVNFDVIQPKIPKNARIDGINYFTVAGHQKGTLKQWQKAMEINWITKRYNLAQCVPPAYSKYIMSNYLVNWIKSKI